MPLELVPFLYSPLALGVILMMIFVVSTVIFTIPVFATRGTTQVLWFLVVGGLLTVEAVALITVGILNSNGDIL